ncbi:hypothetical protein FQR65_LT15029 [Abscondita terminalis]|nr:hypothetical protein FQR65_LT15029 [Abscondita terminalis]
MHHCEQVVTVPSVPKKVENCSSTIAELKLTINYLTKQELSYKLSIRGGETGTVEEMRKRLAVKNAKEKEDPNIIKDYPDYPYTDKEDCDIIKEKLLEVQALTDKK